MPGDSRLSARFGAETDDFKNGITEINRELKLIETGFRATASTMDDWSNSSDGLTARMNALNKSIDLQKEKVNALAVKQENMAKLHGENSVEAQKAGIEFNQEAAKLGKLQTELGHTEYSLKGLKNTTGGVRGAFKDFGTQLDQLKQQVPMLGTAFSLLSNPITLAIAGIGAFAKFAENATQKTLEYNKQVMEMGLLTGLSAEETSRIIQVADDWEIEIGTVSKAMELMNKKGITPSIDNLAILADRYVTATDKSAFMEEASKKYGKSIGDLIPILAKGGDALREQAASIDDSMLATDESIESSRKFKVSLDNLNDTFQGIGYTVGNKVIPPLTDFFNIINNQLSGEAKLNNQLELYNMLVDQGYIKGKKLYAQTAGASLGVKGLANTLNVLTIILDEYNNVLKYSSAIEKEEAIRRGKLNDVTEDSAAAQLYYNDAVDEYIKRSPLFLQQYQNFIDKAKEIPSLLEAVNVEFGNYQKALGAPIQSELDSFYDKQKNVSLAMLETQDKIDELNGKSYLTKEQKKELTDLKQKQLDLQDEYKNNADEHNKALHRILLDIYTEKLATANLTDDERIAGEKMLEALALKWGLIDEATLKAERSGDAYAAAIAAGDMAKAQAILDDNVEEWAKIRQASRDASDATWDYNDALDGMDGKEVETWIITHHVEKFDTGAGRDFGAAGGANFIVPENYPNDSFNLGLTSGEGVIVIPPGKMFGNSLAAIQQMFLQSIKGLNAQINTAIPRGGVNDFRDKSPAAAVPIQIILQGAPPEDEMKMRRQARYIAEEIKRRSS